MIYKISQSKNMTEPINGLDQTIQSPNNHTLPGWFVAGALTLILLLGAVLRLTGVNWDAEQHLHPDERFLTMVTSALQLPGFDVASRPPEGCAKWGGYFDTACSPLNPYNHNFGLFVYGTFPIFLTRIVGEILGQAGYGNIHLVGRVLSALFDLSTVLLIFFIGRRMYDTRAALLGALFLAASVLDIQQSHFFTVDTFTNVPILLAFWFALDISERKHWQAFIFAGAMFGLALAGRINIAPFVAVIVAASALRAYWQASQTQSPADAPESLEQPATIVTEKSLGPVSVSVGWQNSAPTIGDSLMSAFTRAFGGLAIAGIATLIIFRTFQPYAANGPSFVAPKIPTFDLSHGAVSAMFDVALFWAGGVNTQFSDNMAYIGELVAGRADYPPGHQWTDRPAYLFPFENMVRWGLGIALGLTAWAGFAFALYRLIRFREWKHLLIVTWVGITFAYTGQQWVKPLRYFLQIYPFLALCAGWLLIEFWDRAARAMRYATVARIAVATLTIFVIGYTLFYATAFTSIYTRPVSRVTASRWIFDHVPRDSVLANEHWDDPLPLRIDGRDPFGGMYRGLPAQFPGDDGLMNWYDEDTPEKRAQAIRWLNDADYIILSSNRLYGSIPRLPMRYPLTTKYYAWLFDGTLGFDQVAEFTSRPQLLGIEFIDDDADETFTVYDHPKVTIFKKSPRFSAEKISAMFNSIDLEEVYRFWPREATQAKTALLLTPADRAAQQSGGTWSEIFHPNDFINQMPVIGWLALIQSIGWLAFPIAFVVFRGLIDRGYVFAKSLGILLVAWGAWILASYHWLPFNRTSIGLIIGLLALVGAIIVWRRGSEIANFLRAQRWLILVEELVFFACFGLFLLIRYGNPDLWHQWYGGEKPMDFAYLNAMIKSTWFPAYDPWFAGGFINYYYFGQLITATLIKFSGIVPEVAYNLALPTFFALLGAGAFSAAFNLTCTVIANHKAAKQSPSNLEIATSQKMLLAMTKPAIFAGLLAVLFVAVIGNLGQIILIGQTLMKIGAGNLDAPGAILASIFAGAWRVIADGASFDVPLGWWYWNATRTIPDTINEFPFFTFLYGDLHAHLMALPFTMLAIGVAINYALRAREHNDDARLPFWPIIQISPIAVVEVIVAALVIGGLRAINYADYPTYLLVIGAAIAIGEYARRREITLDLIVGVGWRFGAVFVLSSWLYQPFVSNFATAYLATELWKGERTTLGQYFIVHGIFLFAIATYLIARTFDTPARREVWATWQPLIIVAFIVIEAFFLVLNLAAFTLAFPLLVLAGLLFLRPELNARERFIALLLAAGLALTMMVELITYKGDIGRMNTVFKFYLQAWNFFALAAATGIAFLHQTDDRQPMTEENIAVIRPRSSVLPFVWWFIFSILIAIGLTYTITATRAKVTDRFVLGSPAGLNGMEFLKTATYQDRDRDMTLEYDRQAFEWLRANVIGSPVILEGNAPLYHWASRVSIYTGLPTVIGWDWHQKQQRSIIDGGIIDRRMETVRTIYNTRDPQIALAQMERFDVRYVYIGELEMAFYDHAGLAKFDAMARAGTLALVYQNPGVTIYQVNK